MARASFKLITNKDLAGEQNNRLWNLNDKQSDYVAMMTHQLKTPLAGIKWTLSMLLREEVGELTEEQKKWLQTSFDSNERVLCLIDEMLESIRIDEDKLVIEKQEESLVEVFRETIAHLEPLIKKKSINLTIDVEPKGDTVPVSIDKAKMTVAFQNLVENAIRYTREKGNIVIHIIKESGDIKVSIKDDGIGIPESEKKDIFARFFRASNAFKKLDKGSGLGLFISKGIIEKHGGNIWFDSSEEKGTTFYFIIPTT